MNGSNMLNVGKRVIAGYMLWSGLIICGAGTAAMAGTSDAPEQMQRDAEQLISRADADRNEGRTEAAMSWYVEARDLYGMLQDRYPEWNEERVRSRLFYCRQNYSQLEQQQEADEELGALLDDMDLDDFDEFGMETDPLDEQIDDSLDALLDEPTDSRGMAAPVVDMVAPIVVVEEVDHSALNELQLQLRQALQKNEDLTRECQRLAADAAEAAKRQQLLGDVSLAEQKARQDQQLQMDAVLRLQEQEKAALQKKLDEADKQTAQLKRELEAVQKSDKSGDRAVSRQLRALKKQISTLEQDAIEAGRREQILHARIDVLQSGGEDWDAPVPLGTFMSAPAPADDSRALEQLKKELAQREKEVRSLEKDQVALQCEVSKLRSAKREEDRRSPVDATAPDTKKITELQQANRRLATERQQLEERTQVLQRQLDAEQKGRNLLTTELESTDQRRSMDLLQTKQALTAERSRNVELEETVRALQTQLRDEGTRKEELQQTLRAARLAGTDSLGQREEAVSDCQDKLALAEQAAVLQQKNAQDLQEKLDEVRRRMMEQQMKEGQLQRDYLQLAEATAVTASENLSMKSKYTNALNELEAARDQLGVMTGLEEQLEQTQAALAAAEMSRNQRVEELQVVLEQQRAELQQVQEQCATQDAQLSSFAKLESEVELQQLEKAEWQQWREQQQAREADLLAEKMDVEIRLATMTSEKAAVERTLDKMKADYRELAKRAESNELALQQVQREHEQALNAQQQETERYRLLAEQRKDHQEGADIYREQVAALQRQLDQIKQRGQVDLQQLQAEFQAQQLANGQLEQSVSDAQQQVTRWMDEARMLKAAVAQVEQEKQKLGAQVDVLARENHEAQLETQRILAQEKTVSADYQDQSAALRDQLKNAQHQNMAYEKRILELERAQTESAQEIDRLESSLREDLARTVKEGEGLTARVRTYEERIKELEQQRQAFQQQVEDSALSIVQKDRALEQITTGMDELKQEHKAALNRVQVELVKQKQQLEQVMVQRAAEKRMLKESIALSEQDRQTLEREIERADQAWRERLAEVVKERAAEHDKMQAMQKELDRFTQARRQWNSANEDISNQMKEIQSQVSGLTRQLQVEKEAKDALLAEKKALENAAARSSAEQNVELEKVREALILAQKTGAQTRDGVKELQAQLAKMEAGKRELESSVAGYKQQLEDQKQSAEQVRQSTAKLEQQLQLEKDAKKALLAEKKTLENAAARSAEQKAELEKVRGALVLAQRTGAQTRDGLKKLQTQYDDLLTSTETNKKLIDRLKVDLADAEKLLESCGGDKEELRAAVNSSRGTMKDMQAKLAGLEAGKRALESKVAGYEQQFNEQKKSDEQVRRSAIQLEQQLELLKQKLADSEKEKQALNVRVKSLTQELRQATETLESLANF